MVHASCAGVLIAETASQLVLGALLCATYFTVRRNVEWLGFGIACFGLGAATWALRANGDFDVPPSRAATMAFTVGCTLAVVILVFGLAWLTRRTALRRLAWSALSIGALWQVVLGKEFSTVARIHREVLRSGEMEGISLPFGLFLGSLALIMAVATVLFCRTAVTPASERRVTAMGLTILSVGLLYDGVAGRLLPTWPPAMPHAALGFSSLLVVSLLMKHNAGVREAKSLAERLSLALDELAAANATVERLQSELGRKKQLAVVGELAAAIAHEVRNPLAIIMNAAAGLRRPTILNEDRATLLSILDEETARLNRLVTDLLRFARPVIIKRSSVSILELARRAEGRLEDKHRLSIEIPDQPHLKSVEADANLLRLVFDNLVSNAFQAMPEGGVVEIQVSEALRAEERFVRIDIIDQGHGMDEQVLARATDPFYTTRPSGTGLGLPIVQRIVEAHGGHLAIQSNPGQGTKVSLFLPLLGPASESVSAPAGRS